MKCHYIFLFIIVLSLKNYGQDSIKYKLRLDIPVVDIPQNFSAHNKFPSMNQSLNISRDFYELSYWGIDELGDRLFPAKTKWKKRASVSFKYIVGLGFSKYGSELPVPLGVWGHEEFHRSVLGVGEVSSKNGNWILNRWDGTVYGISDETLNNLKQNNLNQLLYSYTVGIQYEVALNQSISVDDFFYRRSLAKNSQLLYNAYYVFDYFKFSTSALSDSVKVLAPPHESKNPLKRDYAGADLTAWAYDMFNPYDLFTARDSFPDGEGVNRRIGFSDLSKDARNYLVEQKKWSLINFINPAIFFVNRIKINKDFSFNFFAQYAPTYFGNDKALFLPLKWKNNLILLDIHNYRNYSNSGFGAGIGFFDYKLSDNFNLDFKGNFWNQPLSFWSNDRIIGGNVEIKGFYMLSNKLSVYIGVDGKTKGWLITNPYLDSNFSICFGLKYCKNS